MKIRPVDLNTDYVFLEQWFKERNWAEAPTKNLLPGTGWIVFSDTDEPLAAGWMYLTNSSVRILEWTVTNPNSHPIKRLKALRYLIQYIEDLLVGTGCVLMQFIPDQKLAKFYESSLGFTKSEDAAILIKKTN